MLHKSKLAQSKRVQEKHFFSDYHISKFVESKWNLLYLVLTALILFSIFAIPKIAVSVVEQSREKIITIETAED